MAREDSATTLQQLRKLQEAEALSAVEEARAALRSKVMAYAQGEAQVRRWQKAQMSVLRGLGQESLAATDAQALNAYRRRCRQKERLAAKRLQTLALLRDQAQQNLTEAEALWRQAIAEREAALRHHARVKRQRLRLEERRQEIAQEEHHLSLDSRRHDSYRKPR